MAADCIAPRAQRGGPAASVRPRWQRTAPAFRSIDPTDKRMKRIRFRSAWLLPAAALLAACAAERPTAQEYYSILPDIIRFAEQDARKEAMGHASEGPLWVDSASFAGGGFTVTRQKLSRDSVILAMRNPDVRAVAHQQVIMLRDTGGAMSPGEGEMLGMDGGRWVREYGVLVRLNMTLWEPGEIQALVGTYTTDRRRWPTGICRRVLRLTYTRGDDGAWTRTKDEVRRACDDPD